MGGVVNYLLYTYLPGLSNMPKITQLSHVTHPKLSTLTPRKEKKKSNITANSTTGSHPFKQTSLKSGWRYSAFLMTLMVTGYRFFFSIGTKFSEHNTKIFNHCFWSVFSVVQFNS